MAHLSGEKKKLVEKQISMQKVPFGSSQSSGQNDAVSPDIIRLLDLLARIEIRRQAKQRSTDKNKAS